MNRAGESTTELGDKVNASKDILASLRINDFMADPGPIPFRHETTAAARRCMAHRIMEFDRQFSEGAEKRSS